MAHVLVLEIYRDYGMKIEDSMNELQARLSETPAAQARQPRPADEATAMLMLQEAMKNSNFRGPRG